MNALTLELANGIIASTFSKSPEMKLKPVGTPFCGAIRAKGSTLSVVSSIGAISWLITPRRIRLSESFEDIGTASRFSSWHSLSRSTVGGEVRKQIARFGTYNRTKQ
jgi:hypothetical protein